MTTDAPGIVTAVRRHYGCETDGFGPEWAALDEMDLQPGVSTHRIDLLLIRAWSGKPKGHERHAVEVKVDRADLRREVNSGKWEPWAAVTNRFFLAVPDRLNLDGINLPDQWGVLTVTSRGVRRTRPAALNDTADDLPEGVLLEAFRRASRAEARIRQADTDDLPAKVAQLERNLASTERKVSTARQSEQRWRQRANKALQLFAAGVDDVRCRCGTRIVLRPRHPFGRADNIIWQHDGEPGVSTLRPDKPCDWPSIDLARLVRQVDRARTA